ncbi:glutamine-rich protein 2 [Silurus meridionalis]|nr:glutamine-rich protein 2 [Silurus meridionalis]
MQDLFKENQDLKEKTYSLKKEVESLQNQITQLVTLEHVQATLDCQKESIMKELKDYVSKTQLLDTSTEFVIPGISEEAMPQPLSQDLTQFNTGVETQKILMIVYQMREKLDSLEARLRCLEGDITTPVYSQQQSDPNSKGVLMVVNQLREKLDSLGARVKQIEGDVRAPLSSQQQIDPSSQGALVDVNQLWEKLDSLEARVKHLEGDIGAPLPSQQQIDPSSQQSLVDVDQIWKKLDSLEALVKHLEGNIGAAMVSPQQTEPSSQRSLLDVNQLQEKLDSLEARMNHLEGERKKLLDQVNQLKAHSMSDVMDERTMVSMTESLAEGTVDMSGSSGLGKELAKSETTESQSSDRFTGTEQQLHQADLRIAVQKLQKDMQNMYRELLTSIEKQKGSIEKEIPVEGTELTSDMQRVVLQLQARCDELHRTTTQLMKDHMQEKGHIKHLYKTTKELVENKADKAAINIGQDIKSDMEALEAKVHLYDTTANKLDKDHHELISIITDHEENCLKIDEIRSEIKLNVDPLKKQLKIFQMNFQKALDVPKADDAAGFKKKLLTRYNCLSCDRAVDLQTPGPHLVVLPEFPNLPPSKIHKRLKKGTHFAKEPDTCALDKKVSEEYQDGMRSPINRLRASTGSIQKEKLWIPEESIP